MQSAICFTLLSWSSSLEKFSSIMISETPLVSIVLPVYNGEKYLAESLDSVLAQTYQNWELVIINDGSTDGTENLILGYGDKRIKYLLNEGNKGIIYSLNRGLLESNGDFIARLDADDIALPFRIQRQVEFLSENTDFALCGTYFQTIDSNGKVLKNVTFPSNNRDAQSYLLLHNCFCHSAIMMRSGIAKELKYDEKFLICEDYDLWYRISRTGKILNLPEFATLYRVHDNNMSTKKSEIMFAHVYKINKRILDDLGIEYSTAELDVHSNALSYNASFFREADKIQTLENWMVKLHAYLKKKNDYNAFLCYKILIEKWIVITYNTRNFKKMLINKLMQGHPSVYLNGLVRKIKKNI
jgi:glycosyltransferase involved in cell wall biosynthesis